MFNDQDSRREPLQQPAMEMDGAGICDPGCYLHVASGLLTRIRLEDLGAESAGHALKAAGRVVRLSSDPEAPLHLLRVLAARHLYHANF